MEELWSYTEIIEYIEEDFDDYMDKKGNYKFNLDETIGKMFYEYEEQLKDTNIESVMIFIEIAKNILKRKKKLLPRIRNEIMFIKYNNIIEKLKDNFQNDDYHLVKAELEKIFEIMQEKGY